MQQARLSCSHYLPEFAQFHIHWVSDPIQSSNPLSPPFTSCPQFFPTSEFFPVSQLFTSNDQSVEASATASVLPMTIQDWFHLGLIYLIPLQSKGFSRVFSNTIIQNHQFFGTQLSLWYLTSIDDYWKTIALTRWTFVSKLMFQLFNMLYRLVIAFLLRSTCLNYMAAVTVWSDFGAPKNSLTLFPLFPHLFPMKWWDWMPWS